MATTKRGFTPLGSEEYAKIESKFLLLVQDAAHNTVSSYSPDTEKYPDNLIPFVDKHMNYLRNHPSANPYQYIANVRLMTRIK